MALKFNVTWRFKPPPDGQWHNASIPQTALAEFSGVVMKLAAQGKRWDLLEHFKRYFCNAVGTTHVRSSTESWAESDLDAYMNDAARNAPVFLDALWEACEDLGNSDEQFAAPYDEIINGICERQSIGYFIQPPNLLLREKTPSVIAVEERPPSLEEESRDVLEKSLRRSEELLRDNREREAVQEILWILESVATAFRGLNASGTVVEGKYFNQIVRELRGAHPGAALDRILEWLTNLHGYLSSPTGGGIRHGVNLKAGIVITPNEARLYCNLVRSYLSYLLSEHERLSARR